MTRWADWRNTDSATSLGNKTKHQNPLTTQTKAHGVCFQEKGSLPMSGMKQLSNSFGLTERLMLGRRKTK